MLCVVLRNFVVGMKGVVDGLHELFMTDTFPAPRVVEQFPDLEHVLVLEDGGVLFEDGLEFFRVDPSIVVNVSLQKISFDFTDDLCSFDFLFRLYLRLLLDGGDSSS